MSESTPRAQDLWIYLTTVQGTYAWVRIQDVSSYGESPPTSSPGGAWITLAGTSERWYVMESVDVLHTILGNRSPMPPPPA